MTNQPDGGPAFPDFGHQEGLTLRQYAAIHLRVANSGDDWLDEMITKSNRDRFAGQAMSGLDIEEWIDKALKDDTMSSAKAYGSIARYARGVADAMMKEQSK